LRFADERDRSRLATADAKDRAEFVSKFNGRDDGKDGADYFSRQHTYNPANGDRSGTTFTVPQVDTYRAVPNIHDRYRRNFADKPGRRAAAANG
jgi:hypothetical protein